MFWRHRLPYSAGGHAQKIQKCSEESSDLCKASQNEAGNKDYLKGLAKERLRGVLRFCAFSVWTWAFTCTKHQQMFVPWTWGTISSDLCPPLPGAQNSSLAPYCRRLGLKWQVQQFQLGFQRTRKMFQTLLRAGHCLCQPGLSLLRLHEHHQHQQAGEPGLISQGKV